MARIGENGLRLALLLLILTGCANKDWEEKTTFRAPTETEIREFGEQKGTLLAKRLYHDHAILLGANFVYSLYYNLQNDQQAFGSSGFGSQVGVTRTAITRESNFIGIVINDPIALREAVKMKIRFDDGTVVETALKNQKAHIIDHPLGKWTVVTKTNVQLLNGNDELIYEVPLQELQ